jgi:DNA-binding MarR family transcriptional regulator
MRNLESKQTLRAKSLSDLIVEVFRLNGRLLEAGDSLVADIALTSARWQVIGAIVLSPVPLPVAHIARNMGLSRQSVQQLANDMEKDGLVRFAPNPHHARAKLVLLTERGTSAYRKAMARQAPWVRALGTSIEAKSVDAARGLLKKLRMRLEGDDDRAGGRQGGRPAPARRARQPDLARERRGRNGL